MKLYDKRRKGEYLGKIYVSAVILGTASITRGLFNGTFRRKGSSRRRRV